MKLVKLKCTNGQELAINPDAIESLVQIGNVVIIETLANGRYGIAEPLDTVIQKLTDKLPTTGWISCDVAMPSPMTRVLVRWPHDAVPGYFYALGGWTGSHKKWLFDEIEDSLKGEDYLISSKITHWMEIPE
jgi:uncharacterized protein YlzI (FlbEa/FlbD family)